MSIPSTIYVNDSSKKAENCNWRKTAIYVGEKITGYRNCMEEFQFTVQQNTIYAAVAFASAAFFFLVAAAANTSWALKVPSIACTGHFAVHIPQPIHFSCAIICCFLGSPLAALTGQTLAHIWHPMHLSVTTALGLWGIKSTIASVGQTPAHSPHTLHLPISIRERLFPILGASKGQTFTHFPHAIHPTSQFFRTTPPLSIE